MKRKTLLIVGILATIIVFGAVAAFAQNSSEKKKDIENHECTPEMMKDMAKNCPGQMMQSNACENMMNNEKGRSGMMGKKPAGENTEAAGESHCEDMGSDMGSMMGSGIGADKKSMM